MAHGMDYLKISLGNIADLMDRQLTLLISDKTNRGLPPNLADWDNMPEKDRHLHHGLKGLHQLTSAVTSEIMAKTIPNSIFSRSSESHNQDKVSLGLSAATQCSEITDSLFNISAAYLICLAQAIDLRKINLVGKDSQRIIKLIRKNVPFVKRDTRLDKNIKYLIEDLKSMALKEGSFLSYP
jgi:histidine ammonia-lyase/phenylalanine ammonia-lyase